MRHDKIIRREDGSRVRISVDVRMDFGDSHYSFNASKCEKGKRTFISPHSDNDYIWRALNTADRREYQNTKYYSICTPLEVYYAYLELWDKAKPKELI